MEIEVLHLVRPEPEPDKALVATLELLLARARSGELTQFSGVTLSNGNWATYTHGIKKVADYISIAGMLDASKNRILGMITWGPVK